MYYPVGVAVSPGGHTLWVVNSDFDLQYNAGTVLALDLDRIRSMIPPLWDPAAEGYPCRNLPLNVATVIYPGKCGAIDLKNPPDGKGSLVASSTEIGAFATDIMIQAPATPTAGDPIARLFIPVRGDPSLTFIEVQDDRQATDISRVLRCGQTDGSPRCSGGFRAGEDPGTNQRGAVLPPEPFGVAATDRGDALVVTHQTTGTLSLVTNPWAGTPTLQFVLGGFPYGAVGIAALPTPRFVTVKGFDYQPGFLATFRAAPEIDLVRYYDDAAAAPARPFITRAATVGITVNSSGVDSRGIAIDATARRDCEGGCSDDLECLRGCASVPAQVFIANRSPPSLIVGEARANVSDTYSDDSIALFDSVPLQFGPSRVNIGRVIDNDGKYHPRAFVSCFDSRAVYIYDGANFRQDTSIRTGRGPHALAFDPKEPFMYIVHFTDSYVGVVDLDRRHTTYGTIVASVGMPRPPRETK